MEVKTLLKLSVAAAVVDDRHQEPGLVADRLGRPAVGRARVLRQSGCGAVRHPDGDDRAAPGRRRPPLRPRQGRVLLQWLRGPADRGRGGRHHLGGGAALHPRRNRSSRWAGASRWPSPASALNWLLASRMLAASQGHTDRSLLEADARHLYTDVWTSAGVVVGLVLVHLTGWLWLDPVLAIGVALNILREGAHLMPGDRFEGLMDSAIEPRNAAHESTSTLAQFAHHDHPLRSPCTPDVPASACSSMCTCTCPSAWTLGRAAALRTQCRAGADEPMCRACVPPSNCCRWMWKRTSAILKRPTVICAGPARDPRRACGGRRARSWAQSSAGLLVLVCAEPADSPRHRRQAGSPSC